MMVKGVSGDSCQRCDSDVQCDLVIVFKYLEERNLFLILSTTLSVVNLCVCFDGLAQRRRPAMLNPVHLINPMS